jgi:cytochrome c
MQIKIVIGTIAFMLTMMVFGYAALREQSRLERFANAELGRSIEAGSEIFVNNCATCHGIDGTTRRRAMTRPATRSPARGCRSTTTACSAANVSQRMTDMGWERHEACLSC